MGYKKQADRNKQQPFALHFSKKERSALCDKAFIHLLVIPQDIMETCLINIKKANSDDTAALRLVEQLKFRTND